MAFALLVLEILIALLVIAVAMLLALYKYNFSYWRRKKVLHVPNPSMPFGNISHLVHQKESLLDVTLNTYNFIKANNAKHGGIYFFGKPIWMPVDLDLLNHVMIQDFSHFVNHGFYINAEHDPLTSHLFNMEDDIWRRMRAALTHTFTSGKLKMMFPIILQNAHNLEAVIKKAEAAKESIDVKDYMSRFTNDVISSTVFGLEVNSIENPENDIKKIADKYFHDSGIEALKFLLSFIIPRKYLYAIKFKVIKPDVVEYFLNIVKSALEYRKINKVERNDFVQLLLNLKTTEEVVKTGEAVDVESATEKRTDTHLSIEEIAAQIFIFYLAGFETSSTALTFALYELALNENIQNTAREEVRRVLKKHNGEMTYEALMELEYLEQVIKETIRKHPPSSMMTRLCTKDYEVPGSEVVIEKDTLVMLPIVGVHRDADIYPDPDKFNPERFGKGNSFPNIAFLAFGEGPRICIAKRFAMIQIKLALSTAIKDHQVTIDVEKTKIPLQYAPKSFTTTANGGVWLNMTRIQ